MKPKLHPIWQNGIPYLNDSDIEGYIKDPFLKYEEVQDWYGSTLPHVNQPWKLVFVTFRLVDSIPKELRINLREAMHNIRRRIENSTHNTSPANMSSLYNKVIDRFNKYLDAGNGSCILRYPLLRGIVEESLMDGHMVEYWVISYVIMPNHVHVLLRPFGDEPLWDVIRRIKSVSSKRIMEVLREGHAGFEWPYDGIWFENYFDRFIRSYPHFLYTLRYIRNNPRNLWYSDYTLGGPSFMYNG